MEDTKNQELVNFYFQQVQEKIKELLSTDKKLKAEDIQKFNDLIFSQKDFQVRKDMEEYIGDTAKNNVDINEVAKAILDKYYNMVFLNVFNKDTNNDLENPLEERIVKTFQGFLKESLTKKQYYIPWSSWFDANHYDVSKMKKVVALFVDFKDIWDEVQFGWSNQPVVVCFSCPENLIPRIKDKLNSEFKTQWIRINEKDW